MDARPQIRHALQKSSLGNELLAESRSIETLRKSDLLVYIQARFRNFALVA